MTMSELRNVIDPSLASLKDNKPPSEEADGVLDLNNSESSAEHGNEKQIPATNSIEELKKLTDLISIRMAENGNSASKMRSIFSFKRVAPPRRYRTFQQGLNARHQNVHQPNVPATWWQKFVRFWSMRKWVRHIRRRARRRRRRILLQMLQNAQNPPPPRRPRNQVPLMIRVRSGLVNFFRFGRPARVAPVNNGPETGNRVVLGNFGPRQQNVIFPPSNGTSMDRNHSVVHNNSLRRRTHLLELFDVELVDQDPRNIRTENLTWTSGPAVGIVGQK